ncbi:DEAD/DEAH box helicase family protein, partial [bacterium]|nr:DEAD/DEAH box helicase family protein [bacterium]
MDEFKLVSEYQPGGDQPQAIAELVEGVRQQQACQTLLGVTGSGKTFTMANVIQQLQMPALIISHNKTLAAQLYGEFKGFFPDNAVEYFVSYYDYYQPEAYKPSTDTYIEKEVELNEEIDRLRLKAISSLLQRRDVIIIATVSCIYGIGSPRDYDEHKIALRRGDRLERDDILRALIDSYYRRYDLELQRGCFRVRGDIIEIVPGSEDRAVRIEMFGDEIESIHIIDALTGEVIEPREQIALFPAKAYVTDEERVVSACDEILTELEAHILDMRSEDKLVEAHRLETRTKYDVELIREVGFCPGIENYSGYMDGRKAGAAPYVLFDYFPEDYLLFIDESHVTVPQIRGMFRGDRSRKDNL